MLRLLKALTTKRTILKLQDAQRVARAAYDAAKARGDTREQHDRRMDLQAATHALIHEELALRRLGSPARRRATAERLSGLSGSAR